MVPLLFVAGETAVVIGAAVAEDVRLAAVVATAWIVAAGLCYVLFFHRPAGGRAS